MSNTDQAPEPSMEEILSSIRRIISDDSEPSSEKEEVAADPETSEAPELDETLFEEAVEPEPLPEMEVLEDETEAAPEPEPVVDEEDDIFELTNVVEVEEEGEPQVVEVEEEGEPQPEEMATEDDFDMSDFEVESAVSGADIEDDIDFVNVDEEDAEVMALPELGPEPVLEENTSNDADDFDRLVSDSAGVAAAASFGDLANTLLSRGDSASTLEELVQEMLRPMLKGWLDANLPTLVEKLVSEEIERIARRGR